MSDVDPLRLALDWGQVMQRTDAAGKTLLAGWRAGDCRFALAAGLAGGNDRERFAVLARYLLRREQADGYWLVFPAQLDGAELLAAEACVAGQRDMACVPLDGAGEFTRLDESPPLGDLLDGGDTLPALMRRELDHLAGALAVPPP